LNEKRVQQVLEIEKQAQTAYETAVNEAREIPLQAEQEAQLIVEKARAEADAQARQMIESAQSEEEIARIISQAEEKTRRAEGVAKTNFERAVLDVLCRVVGKE
jgi:vacuolar-type H+-ATPase subunit H